MTRRSLALIKALVIFACLLPFAWIAARAFGFGDLGANPVQMVLHTFGKTGLNLLILTLAITPIRKQTGLNWLVALRRTLGLAAFAYILLHATTYAVLDQGLAWRSLLVDVAMRPFITVGFLALVLMVPLAITSTNGMQRQASAALGPAPSTGLSHRHPRGPAFFLAGQNRRGRTIALRCGSGPVAGIPCGGLAAPATTAPARAPTPGVSRLRKRILF